MFENKDKIILVMEYADGGELYDYINDNNNQLSERDARRIFRQIVSAIKYCHKVRDFCNVDIFSHLKFFGSLWSNILTSCFYSNLLFYKSCLQCVFCN